MLDRIERKFVRLVGVLDLDAAGLAKHERARSAFTRGHACDKLAA
jgi:hypothetical protein